MLKKMSLALVGLAVGAMAAGYSVRAAEPLFDDAQKEELHGIIRDYLISNPDVIREAMEALQAQEEAAQAALVQDTVRQNADALFRSEYDFVLGNPEGSLTMVEFFDYNCGYCKRSLDDVVALVETDPEIKFVFKEFPILGEGSVFAARAAIAARKQGKYWEFHQAMMRERGTNDEEQVMRLAADVGLDVERLRTDMEADEVDLAIQRNYSLAEAMGIQGTPAFFIDDRLIPGALGLEGLRTQIAEVRAEGTCVAC
jgi:protein-disulfide isomerase